jgi:uncharacterized protein (DUF427 family)
MTDAHRITIEPSNERVRVTLGGALLAETISPVVLREGKLPVRYYIDPADVRLDLLESSDTSSHCPFKGDASYWSVRGGPSDIAWTYREPIEGAEPIRGLICFYNEKVTLEIS